MKLLLVLSHPEMLMYSQLRRNGKKWTWVLSAINLQTGAYPVGTPGQHDRQMCRAARNSGENGATQVPIFVCTLLLCISL